MFATTANKSAQCDFYAIAIMTAPNEIQEQSLCKHQWHAISKVPDSQHTTSPSASHHPSTSNSIAGSMSDTARTTTDPRQILFTAFIHGILLPLIVMTIPRHVRMTVELWYCLFIFLALLVMTAMYGWHMALLGMAYLLMWVAMFAMAVYVLTRMALVGDDGLW